MPAAVKPATKHSSKFSESLPYANRIKNKTSGPGRKRKSGLVSGKVSSLDDGDVGPNSYTRDCTEVNMNFVNLSATNDDDYVPNVDAGSSDSYRSESRSGEPSPFDEMEQNMDAGTTQQTVDEVVTAVLGQPFVFSDVWTVEEKKSLLSAIKRVGPNDAVVLQEAVGTKTVSQVLQYLADLKKQSLNFVIRKDAQNKTTANGIDHYQHSETDRRLASEPVLQTLNKWKTVCQKCLDPLPDYSFVLGDVFQQLADELDSTNSQRYIVMNGIKFEYDFRRMYKYFACLLNNEELPTLTSFESAILLELAQRVAREVSVLNLDEQTSYLKQVLVNQKANKRFIRQNTEMDIVNEKGDEEKLNLASLNPLDIPTELLNPSPRTVAFEWESMKKHLTRYKVQLDQTVGKTERTDVLSNELHLADAKVESLSSALKNTRAKLNDCLRSKSQQDNTDKRRKKLAENDLALTLSCESRQLCELNESSLLGQIMSLYSEALSSVVSEQVQTELDIEKRVLDRFSSYSEDEANIRHLKQKLKNLTLDMDGAKAKLANATTSSSNGKKDTEKIVQLQDEYDAAVGKVESCKDQVAAEIYKLAAKEVEMANIFNVIVDTQLEYHRSALAILTETAPLISEKIDSYSRRPVYGCALEDHLRYSGRKIALVIEVCCAAIAELGFGIEGLFRVSGNQAKVKRIKCAFDAGEIDLTDMETDPHAIAGALKLYLRELPDPITKSALYNEWMGGLSCSRDHASRVRALTNVICKLPDGNYQNLRFLIRFLAELVKHSDSNKMTQSNVAIVVAPNIIWSPLTASPNSGGGGHVGSGGAGTGGGAFYSSNSAAVLVEFLIENADALFPGHISFQNNALVATLTNNTGGFQDSPISSQAMHGPMRVTNQTAGHYANQGGSSASLVSHQGKPQKPKAPAPPPPQQEKTVSPSEEESPTEEIRVSLYPQLSCEGIYDEVDITSSDTSSIGSGSDVVNYSTVNIGSAARKARRHEQRGTREGLSVGPNENFTSNAHEDMSCSETEDKSCERVAPQRPSLPPRPLKSPEDPNPANSLGVPVAKPRKLKSDSDPPIQPDVNEKSLVENRRSVFEGKGSTGGDALGNNNMQISSISLNENGVEDLQKTSEKPDSGRRDKFGSLKKRTPRSHIGPTPENTRL